MISNSSFNVHKLLLEHNLPVVYIFSVAAYLWALVSPSHGQTPWNEAEMVAAVIIVTIITVITILAHSEALSSLTPGP